MAKIGPPNDTPQFAAAMSDLHYERANWGPEEACWGHRQRHRWWEREYTRRVEAGREWERRLALAYANREEDA